LPFLSTLIDKEASQPASDLARNLHSKLKKELLSNDLTRSIYHKFDYPGAGANFGSGWAIIGEGQVARWGRYVFEHGAQRGAKVLEALELGSSQTLDVHLHFIEHGNRMLEDYLVQEYILVGTQADPEWFTIPVRYAKEDGSDGTVRVSGSNLSAGVCT
jgi:hypothetical protein